MWDLPSSFSSTHIRNDYKEGMGAPKIDFSKNSSFFIYLQKSMYWGDKKKTGPYKLLHSNVHIILYVLFCETDIYDRRLYKWNPRWLFSFILCTYSKISSGQCKQTNWKWIINILICKNYNNNNNKKEANKIVYGIWYEIIIFEDSFFFLICCLFDYNIHKSKHMLMIIHTKIFLVKKKKIAEKKSWSLYISEELKWYFVWIYFFQCFFFFSFLFFPFLCLSSCDHNSHNDFEMSN